MTTLKKRTNMHEWPFEHLGISPSHQDPSTSEEERCQQHGYRADECIKEKIHFELLWRALSRKKDEHSKARSKNDEVITMLLEPGIRLVQSVYADQKSWIYVDRVIVCDTPLYRV